MRWIFLLLFGLSLSSAPAQIAPELREQGVLYFDGNVPDKITATLNVQTTVYTHRDFQTAIAALYNGQKIELIGMCPDGYIIKTNYRNNTISGWIRAQDLPTGIDPQVFVTAQKNQERRDAVAVAIANKSVIRGMTTDEVKQSVGRPEQTSSHTDASGTEVVWTYTTYREEPQNTYVLDAFGRPCLQTYYVKIPVGQLMVTFDGNGVTSVAEHKVDPNSPGVVTN